jgi:hypothetical protein
MIITPGTTSVSVDVQIVDDSGAAVTGLVAATFPAVYYSVSGPNAAVQITPLSDLALITTAFTAKGVKERSGSAGFYRLDVPDAAFASAGQLTIYGEASGKHLLVPGGTITVGYIAATLKSGTNSGEILLTAGKINLAPAQSITSLVINNPAGHAIRLVSGHGVGSGISIDGGINGINIVGAQNAIYLEGNGDNNSYPTVYIAQTAGVTNGGSGVAVQNSSAAFAAVSILNQDPAGTGWYAEGGGANLNGEVVDQVALAVRDVNNASPSANSLGAKVNTAASGGGGGTTVNQSVEINVS